MPLGQNNGNVANDCYSLYWIGVLDALIGMSMGVDHGGTRGTRLPRNWSRGTLVQIVPSDFCHIDTKRSVLWPSKYAKIRFRPGTPLGELTTLPQIP